CYPFGEYLHITLKQATDPLQLEQQLKTTFPHLEWKTITPTIEDSFIRLMESAVGANGNSPSPNIGKLTNQQMNK
ncbi:MAG: ABC transporter ATP-binding protein, partial [Capnocytophaga granulosa]